MRSAAVITAAGSGTRMGVEKNKVLLPLKNSTVITEAVKPFTDSEFFQKIVITHSPSDKESIADALKDFSIPIIFVEGGSTRQESVYNGLKILSEDSPESVLIHDAARPWISSNLVNNILEKAEDKNSAVPVTPSVNAMKKIDSEGRITEHLKREQTVSAQTPQGFNYKMILEAHSRAEKEGYQAIDDTELWDRYFDPVHSVPGELTNIKITYKTDLEGK